MLHSRDELVDRHRRRPLSFTRSARVHRNLIGLTGSPEEIQRVADAYKTFYVKVPDERGGYSIDHTGVIYLMGRSGEYLGFMPPQTSPDRLADVLRKNLAHDE